MNTFTLWVLLVVWIDSTQEDNTFKFTQPYPSEEICKEYLEGIEGRAIEMDKIIILGECKKLEWEVPGVIIKEIM